MDMEIILIYFELSDLLLHRELCIYSAGTHLIPKTSSRQRFQDVQNVNSENVHKTLI